MDNLTAPIPSTPTQSAFSSPVGFPNHRWLLWLSCGLAVLTLGIAIGIFSAKFLNQSPSPSPLTSTPTPTLSPIPSPDLYREPAGSAATADWKTYSNSQYQFGFKYPSDYQLEENSDYVSILSPLLPATGKGYELKDGELKVEIYIQPSPTNDSLEAYVEEKKAQMRENLPESKILQESEVETDKTRTILIKWEAAGTGETRYLVKNGYRFGIAKYPLETSRQTEFDQILSTFHFLK